MAYELLTFDVADRIATITVNRPDKLNALNDAVIAELRIATAEARRRPDVGAILLTGAGRAFIAALVARVGAAPARGAGVQAEAGSAFGDAAKILSAFADLCEVAFG